MNKSEVVVRIQQVDDLDTGTDYYRQMFNQSQCSWCINDDNKDDHKEQTITKIMTSSYIFCNAELGDMRFHLNIRGLQRYIF